MAISFVAVGPEFRVDSSSSSSYTLNKPAGLQQGDFMLAFVLCSAGTKTITPPSGWSQVGTTMGDTGESPSVHFSVLKRTAGASEPDTWDGTVGSSSARRCAFVFAWRGCADASQQMLTSDQLDTLTNTNTLATPTVNNTNSNAWRVCAWAHYDTEAGDVWTSNEVAERSTMAAGTTSTNVRGLVSDSNGPIATGNTSRTGTAGSTFTNAAAWIGILKPEAVEAEHVGVAATANSPSVALGPVGGSATAGVTANDATVATEQGASPSPISVGVEALQPTSGAAFEVGALSDAEVAAGAPVPSLEALAELVVASVETLDPAFLVETDPIVVTANDAVVAIEPTAEDTLATIVASDVTQPTFAEDVGSTAEAFDATVSVLAEAGLAEPVVEVEGLTGAAGASASDASAGVTADDASAGMQAQAEPVDADSFTYDPVIAGLVTVSVSAFRATVVQNTVPPTRTVKIPADDRATRVPAESRVVEVTIGQSRARIEL